MSASGSAKKTEESTFLKRVQKTNNKVKIQGTTCFLLVIGSWFVHVDY